MEWWNELVGGRLKSQAFSVFRNRRYKHLPGSICWVLFCNWRWTGDFQVYFILYFSLILWKYVPNVHHIKYCWHVFMVVSWQTTQEFTYLEVVHFFKVFKSCTASCMMTYPSKWRDGIWQGWVFLSVPLRACKYRFYSWVPAKNLLMEKSVSS